MLKLDFDLINSCGSYFSGFKVCYDHFEPHLCVLIIFFFNIVGNPVLWASFVILLLLNFASKPLFSVYYLELKNIMHSCFKLWKADWNTITLSFSEWQPLFWANNGNKWWDYLFVLNIFFLSNRQFLGYRKIFYLFFVLLILIYTFIS